MDIGIYNNISGSMKFEGIRTIQIFIEGSNGKLIILKLSSVKYCLSISTFNLISVS
jgi:hypothetical protein